MLIYIARHKGDSRKVYIGQTTGLLIDRVKGHKSSVISKNSKTKSIFSKAMRKYGFDNFIFEVLEDGIKTREELNTKEIFYIASYRSTERGFGYNQTPGGYVGPVMIGVDNPSFGKKKPHLTQHNKARTGITLSAEHRANIGKSLKGKVRSEESLRKSGESIKNGWRSGSRKKTDYSYRKGKPQFHKRVPILCPELNMTFETITAAAKYLGDCNGGNISSVLDKEDRTHKGLTFRRAVK